MIIKKTWLPVFIFLTVCMGFLNAQEVNLDEAYRFLAAQEYKKAVEIFEVYLAKQPQDARIHLEAAYTYLKMQQDQPALPHFLEYLRIEPANPGVSLDVAYLYLRQNEPARTETFFNDYLKAHPENLDVQAELAFLLVKLGRQEEAITRMQNILAKDAGRETIRLNLAYLLLPTRREEGMGHFRQLLGSADPETKRRAEAALQDKTSRYGYMFYACLYHSFRFDINVLSVNTSFYLKNSFLRPVEPYVFLHFSTDAESDINPFPTIYSEQAGVVGIGLQWYFYKRNARVFVQAGYRQRFLNAPGFNRQHFSLSYGIDSFFYIPFGGGAGLEMNNVFAYHSRFDKDFIFEGKEVLVYKWNPWDKVYLKPYAGVLYRWDSRDYFYNNNHEWVVGVNGSWRGDFQYFVFCEYKRGNYRQDTVYGRHYNEWVAGVIVGIYK